MFVYLHIMIITHNHHDDFGLYVMTIFLFGAYVMTLCILLCTYRDNTAHNMSNIVIVSILSTVSLIYYIEYICFALWFHRKN